MLYIATLLGLVAAGYKYLDLDAMTQAWHKFSWDSWFWLIGLPLVYLLAKSKRFVCLLNHDKTLEVEESKVMLGYAASQPGSLLPGGVALRAVTMYSLGIPVERSSGPVLANSAADQLLLLGTGLYLCYYFPSFRQTAFVLTAILLLLVVLVVLPYTRKKLQNSLLKLLKRFDKEEEGRKFLSATGALANLSLWVEVMAWTLLANGISVTVLWIIIQSFGWDLTVWSVAAAFVIPTLLGRLSPVPAGAGVTEAGMTGFLSLHAGLTLDQAAVATILFRVVDVLLPALYGGLCQLPLQGVRKAATIDKGAL